MLEQEAIRLAMEEARRRQLAITGVESAVYVDGTAWGLEKLGLPGDYWYVFLSLAEIPGLVEPGEAAALAVNCATGEVTLP